MDDAQILHGIAVHIFGHHPDSFTAHNTVDFTWGWAGRVVEKMREKGFVVVIDNVRGFWEANFARYGEAEGCNTMTGDTMPRAVMLAALKAKEVQS